MGRARRDAVPLDVVAAAIVHDGRVLAAHRATAPIGWEFPGGKVESGETARAALAREVDEELAVKVSVGDEIAGSAGAGAAGVVRLRLYACALDGTVHNTERAGPTVSTDHDELRWLSAADLDSVGWLPLDAGLVDAVRDLLGGH